MTSLPLTFYADNGVVMALTTRIAPIFEKHVAPELPGPDRQPEMGGQRLEVSVVYTTPDAAMSALRRAALLAGNLGVRVTLIVPQVVPYPLPLTSPPVL